jgi:hypothetical protein
LKANSSRSGEELSLPSLSLLLRREQSVGGEIAAHVTITVKVEAVILQMITPEFSVALWIPSWHYGMDSDDWFTKPDEHCGKRSFSTIQISQIWPFHFYQSFAPPLGSDLIITDNWRESRCHVVLTCCVYGAASLKRKGLVLYTANTLPIRRSEVDGGLSKQGNS